jgi:hypothetical protein
MSLLSNQTTYASNQYATVQFAGGEIQQFDIDRDNSELQVPRRSQLGWGQFASRVYSRSYEFAGRVISEDPAQVAIISFSTYSGAFLGTLRTDIRYPIIKSLRFTDDEKGSADFEMVLNALPDFPIIPGAIFELRIGDSPVANFTGYLEYMPDQGTRKSEYQVIGYGLRKQLSEWVRMPDETSSVYPFGMTAGEIFDDIMQTIVVPNTNVRYNASKINLTAGIPTANELDFATSDIAKVFDSLSLIANCRWGVDGTGEAYFEEKDPTIVKTWIIGDGMGQFETFENSEDIYNNITVERTEGRGSGGNGFSIAGVYTDSTSIAKYGNRTDTVRVPGFFADAECDIIGLQYLEDNKDPQMSARMRRVFLRNERDIVPRGFHRTILPVDLYSKQLFDDEDASEWTKTGAGDLVLSNDSQFVIDGARSLKLEFTSAQDDVIERDAMVDGDVKTIEVWLYSTTPGTLLEVGFGLTSYAENTQQITVGVPNRWTRFRWQVESQAQNRIRKFGFKVLTDQAATIYLDNMNASILGQQHIEFEFKRATYNLGRGQYIDVEFGKLPNSVSDYTAGLLQQTQENATALRSR